MVVYRLLNRQNMSASGSTSLHHQQNSSGSSLSDLHHPHLPHQRCHGDDDDDDLLLSDSDDFSDHQPTGAAGSGSRTPGLGGDADETGSRCHSPDIDIDDDEDDGLIDPAASPTISVGVSSRCSSPDPITTRQQSGPADSDCGSVLPSSSSASAGSADHHHHLHHRHRLLQQLPALGLGFGVTASALSGLYHQHHQLQQQTRPHHLGPPLIPPGLPFPPTPGFSPFQPSLYPFSPLLSFSVTSPGPNR